MTVRLRAPEKAESFTFAPNFIHCFSDSEVLVLCCESIYYLRIDDFSDYLAFPQLVLLEAVTLHTSSAHISVK